MAFVFASKCNSTRKTSLMDNWDFAVSMHIPKIGKPEMKISFHPKYAETYRMFAGDGCDVGIDPDSHSICLQTVAKGESAPFILHSRTDGGRLGVGCVVRQEWRMIPGCSIPMNPVTHVQSHPGRVIARLPDSWKRFFVGGVK